MLKLPLGAVTVVTGNPFGEPSSFIDPLSSPQNCTRDIPHLSDLGVNTIRVYSVDSSLDHDSCMKALSAANIYTMLANLTPTMFLLLTWETTELTLLYL